MGFACWSISMYYIEHSQVEVQRIINIECMPACLPLFYRSPPLHVCFSFMDSSQFFTFQLISFSCSKNSCLSSLQPKFLRHSHTTPLILYAVERYWCQSEFFHSHFTSIRFVASLTFTDILIKFTTEAAAAAVARDLCWKRTWHFFSNSFGNILGRILKETKRFSSFTIEINSREGSAFWTRSVHNSHSFNSNFILVTSSTQNALVQSNAISRNISGKICSAVVRIVYVFPIFYILDF